MFTDLGGEFDNDLMRLFADTYGITLHCAPGGSHWSLGGVERHHHQLRHTVEMLLEADDTLSMNDACDVACMAANAQPMSDRGFSPQQLVYGVSAKWPDFVSADLPALSNVGLPSDHVGHYMSRFLDAMYEARAKFHAADIRAKISLAERYKPSKNRDVVLTAGDRVFYYEALEKGKDTWHGPASVIGVDHDFVVLRHGGDVRRLPLLRCRLASSVLGNVDPPADDPGEELCPEDVQDVIVDEAGNELTEAEIMALRDEDAGHAVGHSQRDPVMTRSRAKAELALLSWLSTDGAHMGWRRYVSVADPQASRDLLLAHCYVARKSMRKGMREVDAQRASSPEFVMAKQKELASWDACKVYDIVDDHGQRAITCRWVLVDKLLDDGTTKPKARLVVRGFQETGVQDVDTFSPTCSKSSWRVLLTVAVYKGWAPVAIDISTAFLQRGALEREVFVRPPAEMQLSEKLLRLRKAVYGLVDAPLHWYHALHNGLLSLGAKPVPFDAAIYLFADGDALRGWVAVHVDDISVAGAGSFLDKIVDSLTHLFPVGAIKRGEYVYCDVRLRCIRDDTGQLIEVTLDQETYIADIPCIVLKQNADRSRQLEEHEKTLYRGLIGALSWCTGQTRPDFAFATCRLSQGSSQPTVADALLANKILEQMKRRPIRLRFPKLDGTVRMVGYHDASWGNGEGGKTIGGWIWTLISSCDGKRELFCPINWKSRKLRRVVKSTFAGETLACSACVDDVFVMSNLIREITGATIPVTLRTDCASLYDHIYKKKAVTEKRLMVELAVINDAIRHGKVTNLEWVSTNCQLADALTKAGYNYKFYHAISNAILP